MDNELIVDKNYVNWKIIYTSITIISIIIACSYAYLAVVDCELFLADDYEIFDACEKSFGFDNLRFK